MKAYIYDVDTKEVVAVVDGTTNYEIEKAAEIYTGDDQYVLTYTPAFGTVNGLVITDDYEVINA